MGLQPMSGSLSRTGFGFGIRLAIEVNLTRSRRGGGAPFFVENLGFGLGGLGRLGDEWIQTESERPMSVLLVSLGLVLSGVGTETLGSGEKSLRGTVFGKDGKPVSGAVVWACEKYENWERTRQETKTDSRGAYLLKLSPGVWEVFARTDHQVGKAVGPGLEMSVRVNENRDPDSEEILLEDCGSVRIRAVAAEDGTPLSQAKIFTSNGQLLATDAMGEARACGFPDGCHGFVVICRGRVTQGFEFSIAGNLETEVEVRVPKGGIIRGVVKDLEGKPVPGLEVEHLVSWHGLCRGISHVLTNERGEFEMNAFSPPGIPCQIFSTSPLFYKGARKEFDSPKEVLDVQLVMGPRYPQQIIKRLENKKNRLVRGLIQDSQGKPVSGALVKWEDARHVWHRGGVQTRTNEKGEYEISFLGGEGHLSILAKGFALKSQSIGENREERILSTLTSALVAKGAIVDDLGKPIVGAWVYPRSRSEEWNRAWREIAVRTDKNGRFELPGWSEREDIQVLWPSVGTLLVDESTIKGLDKPIVMNRPGYIRGRILGVNKQPLNHFVLQSRGVLKNKYANDDYFEKYFYTTMGKTFFSSTNGAFVISGLKHSCDYSLCCSVEGYGDADKESVRPSPWEKLNQAEQVFMQLEAGHPLKVRVIQQDGRPVSNARLTLVRGKAGAEAEWNWRVQDREWGKSGRVTTNPMGEYDFPHIGPSRGALLIRSSGLASQWVPWDKRTGEMTVKMEPESILEVEVVSSHEGFLENGDYYLDVYGEINGQKINLDLKSNKNLFLMNGLKPGNYYMEMKFGLSKTYIENQISVILKPGLNHFKIDGNTHRLVNP